MVAGREARRLLPVYSPFSARFQVQKNVLFGILPIAHRLSFIALPPNFRVP
jgi:hypothetical protein